MTVSRFDDIGESIYDFLYKYDILIECPHCLKSARGLRRSEGEFGYLLQCKRCGILSHPNVGSWGNGTFMGFNVWLRTDCCGELLWAYNKEHLDLLDGYINASLRERIPNQNQSLASRLPDWIKNRKNRNELAKGIAKLQNKLINHDLN
ncbi:hypothetical protein [Paenibacillus sp. JDR-2]|uniref:hypothetical protein n=1 Tax=Paenibacillus sp. (strain JDR-2) TaxID=324057 RepID=UPI0001AAF83A|nr:hypothetical protein [Paenibacillus sp. JDR-2]ACT03189.1 conserved hypothetical protein [Paenibacillus sp. JDR-2]